MVDSKDSLITFIKNTLGCRCPEEVFENIDVKFIRPIENVGEFARVVVGNTLLVYVYCDGQLGDVISSIEQTTNKGRDDRNKNKYNRFRLVLPDSLGKNVIEEAKVNFVSEFQFDEKLNLHFVDSNQLDKLELKST